MFDPKPGEEVLVRAKVIKFTPEREAHKMVEIYCEYWDEEEHVLVPVSELFPAKTKPAKK